MSNIPSWVLTYDSLTSVVQQYLERKDAAVVNAIPTFITLAEFEIAEQIRCWASFRLLNQRWRLVTRSFRSLLGGERLSP